MRSDAHPAARRFPRLKQIADAAERRSAAGAAVLLAVVCGSGFATSPALPLFAISLVLLLRYSRRALALSAPAVAAAAMLLPVWLTDAALARSLAAVAALLAAMGVGLVWRREERRTSRALDQLDDILDQAKRGSSAPSSDAAAELADLELALAAVADRIRAREVLLWDVDGERGVARPRAGSRGHPAVRTRLAGDPLGWVWEQGMRMRVEPAPRWARPDQIVIAERLVRNDDDRGLLATFAFDPADVPDATHPFDEAAIYLRGVLALQSAHAHVRDRERRLSALLAGLNRMPGDMDMDTVAADLCATAMSMTDATGAALGAWDGEAGTVLAAAGADGGPRPGDTFTAPASELGLAVRAETVLVRSAHDWKHGRTCVASPDEAWTQRPRAMAALPLRSARGTVGVLAVWTSRDATLEEESVHLLHALAPYAALHMDQALEFDTLRESAEQDPLTGLRNRRAFENVLAAEVGRVERYGQRLALLVMDLDHFKAVNDTYGHEAGDEVLRSVARLISGCVRDVDTAARIGGEEFVVLLPETTMEAAVEVAERIRSAVAAAVIEWKGTAIPTRVSIGVSACPGPARHPRDLLGSADAALYAAKEAGRNRVVRAAAAIGAAPPTASTVGTPAELARRSPGGSDRAEA